MEYLKILSEVPKNESGLTQMIMMGKSILQIWVKLRMFFVYSSVKQISSVVKMMMLAKQRTPSGVDTDDKQSLIEEMETGMYGYEVVQLFHVQPR